MQLSLQQSYYQDARTTVRLVDGSTNIYLGLKDFFKNFFVFSIVVVIGSFVLVFLNAILAFLINRLKKSKPLDLSDATPNDYRFLRQNHDDFGILLQILNEIADEVEKSRAETRFLLKWTVNLIIDAREVLVKRYESDAKSFESLAPKKESYKGFERLTEEELWNDRAKAYKYLV
jgi:hypothetical protein